MFKPVIKQPAAGTMPWRGCSQKGFTLIELMATIVILGVLLAIGFPSMQSSIATNRIRSQGQDIVDILNFARSEAITKGAAVKVSPVNSWVGGVNVSVSVYDDTKKEFVDKVIRSLPAFEGGTSFDNGNDISFTERGQLAGSAVEVAITHGKTTSTSSVTVQTGGSISRQ